jgi:hypothetical protein
LFERFKEKVGLIEGISSSLLGLTLSKAFKLLEDSDRVFAVKPTGGTELVENEGFLFKRSFFIAEKNCLDVFFF